MFGRVAYYNEAARALRNTINAGDIQAVHEIVSFCNAARNRYEARRRYRQSRVSMASGTISVNGNTITVVCMPNQGIDVSVIVDRLTSFINVTP
jgi:riboflavin synthase alpha subunit